MMCRGEGRCLGRRGFTMGEVALGEEKTGPTLGSWGRLGNVSKHGRLA